jgi:hypothetical protein
MTLTPELWRSIKGRNESPLACNRINGSLMKKRLPKRILETIKRGRGKPNPRPQVDHSTDGSPERVQVHDEPEDETGIPANDLVDAEGNFLKDESDMTPMELKRARKLARRAQRRIQKIETGISA